MMPMGPWHRSFIWRWAKKSLSLRRLVGIQSYFLQTRVLEHIYVSRDCSHIITSQPWRKGIKWKHWRNCNFCTVPCVKLLTVEGLTSEIGKFLHKLAIPKRILSNISLMLHGWFIKGGFSKLRFCTLLF